MFSKFIKLCELHCIASSSLHSASSWAYIYYIYVYEHISLSISCLVTLIGKICCSCNHINYKVLPMAAMVTAWHVHFHLRSMLTHTQRVPRTLQPYGHDVQLLMTLMFTECTGFAYGERKYAYTNTTFSMISCGAAPNTMVFLHFMFEHEVLYDSPTICSNTLHFICYSSQADAKTLLQSQQS